MQLTINDIVKIFAVPEETVNRWIEKKGMPCIKANEQYRFNYIELLDWALKKNIKLTVDVLALGEQEQRGSSVLFHALTLGNIYYDIDGNTPEEVLGSVVEKLTLPQKLNKKSLWQMLIAREKIMSTAVGHGIAIPHVRNPVVLHVDHPSITLCFLRKPVDFKSLDGEPVNVLFILLSSSVKEHLAILSRLAYCLQDIKLREFLRAKASREQILAEFRVLESKISNVPNDGNEEKDKA